MRLVKFLQLCIIFIIVIISFEANLLAQNGNIPETITSSNNSLATKRILIKELGSIPEPIIESGKDVKNLNLGLNRITEKYQKRRKDDAIANAMLRTTFDFLSYSVSLATGYASGPLAPLIERGVNYVTSKSLGYVANLAEEEMKKSSTKVLKAGLKSYLKNHGIETLKDKPSKEIVNHLNDNGYFPETNIDDKLDENGKITVLNSMIKELANTDKITLEKLAEQGQEIDQVKQDMINLQALGKSMWEEVQNNSSRIKRINENMIFIHKSLQTQIDNNRKDILRNRGDIEYLQKFMFSKMSAKERKSALNNGFFKNMSVEERDKLNKQIETEEKKEQVIKDMTDYLNAAGNVLNIANNLGLDSPILDDVGKVVEAGNHIVAGVTALSSPMGWLSAASSFSNIMSIGRPDAGASRHKQIMQTLNRLLEGQQEIKLKLRDIENNQINMLKNQIEIFNKILDLEETVTKQYNSLYEKLDEIQDDILVNREGIAELVKNRYLDCFPPLTTRNNTFESFVSYEERYKHFRTWNRAPSKRITSCLKGLSNTIIIGDGTYNTAFNAEFDDYNFTPELEKFLNTYWPVLIKVYSKNLVQQKIRFENSFIASIYPNSSVDLIDTIYSKNTQHIFPERLNNFQDIIKNRESSIISRYYSLEATEQIVNLYMEYFPYYELLEPDEGKRLLKLQEEVEVLKGINEPLIFDLQNAILRLDILIFQQNLLSGAPLLSTFYSILSDPNSDEMLRNDIVHLLKNNYRMKNNFILYATTKEIQNSKSTNRAYHFAINESKQGGDWLLKNVINNKHISFIWKDSTFVKNARSQSDLNWHFKFNTVDDDILFQLPSLKDLKTRHLNFPDQLFKGIELRNKLLDKLHGLTFFEGLNENEKSILIQSITQN